MKKSVSKVAQAALLTGALLGLSTDNANAHHSYRGHSHFVGGPAFYGGNNSFGIGGPFANSAYYGGGYPYGYVASPINTPNYYYAQPVPSSFRLQQPSPSQFRINSNQETRRQQTHTREHTQSPSVEINIYIRR